jgi:thiol-disulfide isomerase/thioredoxin
VQPGDLLKIAKRHIVAFYDSNEVKKDTIIEKLKSLANTILNPNEEEIEYSKSQGVSGTGAMVFVACDIREEKNLSILNRFTVSKTPFDKENAPKLRLRALEMYSSGPKVWAPPWGQEAVYETLEGKGLVKFVFDLRLKKLQMRFMSAPETSVSGEPDPDTGFREIVGSQWTTTLMHTHTQEIGVLGYAYLPDCPKCNAFRKKLVEMIQRLKDRDLGNGTRGPVINLELVEMDASKNESAMIYTDPEFTGGYPYLHFCPALGPCKTLRSYETTSSYEIQVFLQFNRYSQQAGPRIYDDEDRKNADKEWEPLNGEVKHLNVFNADEWYQDSHDRVDEKFGALVMFYAPWCKASRKTKPHFASASHKLRKMANFGAINCVTQDGLCKNHLQGSFPLIKAFPPGDKEGIVYDGKRYEEDFITFVEAMVKGTGPFKSEDEQDRIEL